jgi:methyltransferase-like protein/2-polyprenyl-3-methyl-5-hydroxy-6-metoxy-1,4-benzoquinol methylase
VGLPLITVRRADVLLSEHPAETGVIAIPDSIAATKASTYDEVPYRGTPYRLSHPCHVAAVAALFDAGPPAVRGARVLELGCAAGQNLIPMAQDLPESRYVGVDLSPRQIDQGRALVDQLGLDNIELHCTSIDQVDRSWGAFDYIIAHGVFSWVPASIQDHMLRLGRQALAPSGVLYVSYNTNPGWRLRGVVRDMMLYHVAGVADPREKVAQARALLDFLAAEARPSDDVYRGLLRQEAETLRQRDDAYLFHEHLEDTNAPIYFSEFVQRAAGAGLQYLGESDFPSMLLEQFDREAVELLEHASLLRQEQYMDFLRNRTFRATLLCHQELQLDRRVEPQRLEGCHLGLDQRLELPDDLSAPSKPAEFRSSQQVITVNNAATKFALAHLNAAWPGFVPFGDLADEALQAAEPVGGDADRGRLTSDLMMLLANRLVRSAVEPPPCVAAAGRYPTTTPLARLQAQRSDPITNRRHEPIGLPRPVLALLPYLDGAHDRRSLEEVLELRFAEGHFELEEDGRPVERPSRETIGRVLDQALRVLADAALLVA